MYKRIVLGSLVLLLAIGLLFAFGVLPCFAQQQQQEPEEFVITTYYPSPYGSYNELEVHRSVTYKPVDKDTLPSPKEGELVYNSSDGSLYLYNGSSWVAQGGGTAVMYLSCPSRHKGDYDSTWVGDCTPPSCPSGWTSVATFSEPVSVACPGTGASTGCYWDGSGGSSGTYPVVVGRWVRVCVK